MLVCSLTKSRKKSTPSCFSRGYSPPNEPPVRTCVPSPASPWCVFEHTQDFGTITVTLSKQALSTGQYLTAAAAAACGTLKASRQLETCIWMGSRVLSPAVAWGRLKWAGVSQQLSLSDGLMGVSSVISHAEETRTVKRGKGEHSGIARDSR